MSKRKIIDGTTKRRWLGQVFGVLTISLGAWMMILYLRETLLEILGNPILVAIFGLILLTLGVILMSKTKLPRTWA